MDKKINIGTIGNVDSKKTRMTEILKKMEEYLDKLSEEERQKFFKEIGFEIEQMPDNIKTQAQKNKTIIKKKGYHN